jgi:hypothetical protein
MASSKKNKNTTPQDQALAAKRVEFVKAHSDLSPVEARTRFFVQTRAAELQAKGVDVTKQKRQELRQKFASGDVQRTGFYTPGDIARASNNGQNLNEYKSSTGGDQAVRMGRQAAQASRNTGFNEQSLNPKEFFNSPLARGVVSAAKWTGKTAKDVGESIAASSINPVLNIPQSAMANIKDIKQEGIKRFFLPKGGKNYEQAKSNPNFREAGITEKVMNIAPLDVVGSLAVQGAKRVGAKFVSSELAAGVARAGEELAASRLAKITGGKVVRGANKYVAEATAGYANAAKTGTVDLITGAYQDVAKNVAKSTVNKSATKPAAKSVAKKATTKITPTKSAVEKVAPKLETAPKVTPKATPTKSVAPKATPAKATPVNATPAKAVNKEVNRFANAWDETASHANTNFNVMESTSRYSTARRATKVKADVAPAPAPKVTPAKTTAPKARAKAGFETKVNKVKAAPASAVGKSSFGSQAEYDTWLSKGGKQELQNMTQSARDSFLQANKKFVVSAGKKAQAVTQAQAKTTARSLATQARYRGARPELQGLFNEALLNRQKRQLLAKIAPKK